jgi:hypothetical protein
VHIKRELAFAVMRGDAHRPFVWGMSKQDWALVDEKIMTLQAPGPGVQLKHAVLVAGDYSSRTGIPYDWPVVIRAL